MDISGMGFRNLSARINTTAIEIQIAHTEREQTLHKAGAAANSRLIAADESRKSAQAWSGGQVNEMIAAVKKGQERLPGEIDTHYIESTLALLTDPRQGLQMAVDKARESAKGMQDGDRALLLWRARRSSIQGGIGIAALIMAALTIFWITRSVTQRRQADVAATSKAIAQVTAAAQTTQEIPAPATIILTIPGTATEDVEHYIHDVGEGETLIHIAEMYGSTVADLIAYNHLQDENDIAIGQTIRIPPLQPPPADDKAPDEEESFGHLPSVSRLGEVRLVNRGGHSVEQIYVPAGTFLMGSDSGEDDERPVHNQQVEPFWLDRTEVTNGQYAACVDAGACQLPDQTTSQTRNSYYGDPVFNDYPVIWVSWEDANSYCKWAGGRLPTETEWEYAARGEAGYEFPWGDEFDGQRLNYCDVNCPFEWADHASDDGHVDTAPVGSYPQGASWSGALDMAGNVWEWVADSYDATAYGRPADETLQSSTASGMKVLRGGAWYGDDQVSRSSDRNSRAARFLNSNIGLRCAADIQVPTVNTVATPQNVATTLPTIAPTLSPVPEPTNTPLPNAVSKVCEISTGPRWGSTLWSLYDERLGCAVNQEARGNAAYQYFANGITVWRQDRDLIYILYNNSRYATYLDESPDGYHDSDRIKGGFGYLWNTNQTVRDGLGQPLAIEMNATNFAVQDFKGGTIFYFYENDARNYALFDDNRTWTSIQQ